jgi:GNAT superfamily N-acetyltransferase
MLALRPAVPADVDVIRAVAVAAYEGYVSRIGQMPAPMIADYDRSVRDGNVWSVVEGTEVAGFTVLIVAQDHLLLENVAVLPSKQGRGIGTLLLDLAEQQARLHGLREVRLYTNEAMTENLAYYPSRGYVETHRAQQDGFNRVYFHKALI